MLCFLMGYEKLLEMCGEQVKPGELREYQKASVELHVPWVQTSR